MNHPRRLMRATALSIVVLGAIAFGMSASAPAPTATPSTTTVTPTTLPATTTMAPAVVIAAVDTAPAVASESADRVSPMIQEVPVATAPPCNEAGLNCMPFYDGDPADKCAELNFYRLQNPITAAEPRFSDQPRDWTYPKQMGIGWRESNCDNTLTNKAGKKCCGGYYQIGWANITAPGYAAAGVWSNCGITSAQDYVGDSPLQKQKSVCAASGLYLYHSIHGPYAMYPWDAFL